MISTAGIPAGDVGRVGVAGGSGLGGLGSVAAQQRLSQADILRFDPLGTVTILHVTDIHAQSMPLHFREPSVNLGVGEARGLPPHLTDAEFRKHFKIATGSADAFALTSDDFVALARNYGRMGGIDRIATWSRRSGPSAATTRCCCSTAATPGREAGRRCRPGRRTWSTSCRR